MFYVISIIIAITVSYDSHIYFPDKLQKNILTIDFYDNLRPPGEDYIDKLSINADIIKEEYIKLFIYYDINDNNLIGKLCPEYKPDKKEGITSVFNDFEYSTSASNLNISSKSIDPKANKLALKCLSSLYSIYINDSLYKKAEFFFYKHPNKGEKGIITYLPTEGLPKGRNTMEVKKKK
ncbi:MAG: hypothetical protein IIA88_07775, partial [Bacteroidetes bacterium]|nr:hypothetical protein [Bacteroidota bacterium]